MGTRELETAYGAQTSPKIKLRGSASPREIKERLEVEQTWNLEEVVGGFFKE